MDLAKKKRKKAHKPIVDVAALEKEGEMVISRNHHILRSIGHPSLKTLHEDLIRFIATRTELIKALCAEVENLYGTLNAFAELDDFMEENKPPTACHSTQTCPAPSCKDTCSQTDPVKPATPVPAALPTNKPAPTLPAPTKRKPPEAPNPPEKRTNLQGPSKPVPSRASKPAAARVTLHGEKSAAHTVVISDTRRPTPGRCSKLSAPPTLSPKASELPCAPRGSWSSIPATQTPSVGKEGVRSSQWEADGSGYGDAAAKMRKQIQKNLSDLSVDGARAASVVTYTAVGLHGCYVERLLSCTETWKDQHLKNKPTGFHLYESLAQRDHKKGRSSGGIIVGIREAIKDKIERTEIEKQWIMICLRLDGEMRIKSAMVQNGMQIEIKANNSLSKPWFDHECYIAKNIMKTTLTKYINLIGI
ncbi:hypothetical protein LAZ67_11000106 [Cordylochernes scorpioides]|uniref:Uncharacterized protein n=1 Tax=Cordylochernes scorpioides TaxID=51811 RepID=A0ABY6KZY2_9ARAC|nr:hypothetical protein LAZ67_11000106 [Cordylochernes scorpioides]